MFTDLSHRALLFALCSFIMCACFATCYLAQNRAETFLEILPRPNAFSRSALQVIDSRPRVALPSAASSATVGREQHEQRPRVDNFSLSHEGHRLGGGGNLSKTQRLTAANARREGRPECPIPPVAKRCYPRPFPPSPPRSLSPSFSAIHHLQPTKRKINFKKNDKLLPEINN